METSIESNLIDLKIQPIFIPTTAIQRLHQCPSYAGGLGDVWKCSMSTQSNTHLVAVKALRVPQSTDTELVRKAGMRIRRQVYVQMQLSHDHILPLEGITEGFGPLPALVAPWMENGSLNEYLRLQFSQLSRPMKLQMVGDIAAGLQYLHDKDIVHGELTDTNVLVSSEGRLYIGGFGLSMILTQSEHATFNSCLPGNIRWMAPETVTFDAQDYKPTKANDIYSYGCVMMQVFSGRQPYERINNIFAVISAMEKGREPFPQLTGVDEEIQQFAQLCLSRRSESRLLVASIVEFLWSQTSVAETMKTLLSTLPVTVKHISEAVLMKCESDYDTGHLDVLGATLKCKWVVHESIEIEVGVKTLRDDVDSQNDMEKICNRIRREMYVREKLRHEAILILYGMTANFGILPSFVYQWMAGGSLHDYLKREYSNLSARRKLDILLEVAYVIEYLHKWGIVHGNLTGDNILIDGSGRVRIADFSHSMILAEADNRIFSEQLMGDARYAAPESISSGGRTAAPKPTKAGDVYSYGCIAILVLLGKVPYWWISEESRVLSEKEKGTGPFQPTVEISERHLDLMRQCLLAENSRPSIKNVIYLALAQQSGAVDLTNSVQRLDKDPHAAGAYGAVHRCRLHLENIDTTVRQAVACYQLPSTSTCVDIVKEIFSNNDGDMLRNVHRLLREIKLWLELEHENIVPLWGVTDNFGCLPALISPWLKHGALTGYLRREHRMLSYKRKFALLRDIARGLQYRMLNVLSLIRELTQNGAVHSREIIHGDLSGNNVLVDEDGKASLADFGRSALLPERISQALLPTYPGGTMPYTAPECLKSDDEGNESLVFSPTSDVLEGEVPYHYARSRMQISRWILEGKTPIRPHTPVIVDEDWNFIQRCWLEDMEHRPSDEDILEFVEGRARIQS
ncbi:kinase-like domain-containing protein [Suillus clintonianus]|uniref:kinase-like domain-containing protein n=1 Tax=Suillus clintonianus TaxID=1904413 RepID=UPI001B870E8D|nr:kinase-like domain-containing protein [Suillus clintonianus]KAG2140662.1 kinase-like domain-containing protein [Suillus clintonianus]